MAANYRKVSIQTESHRRILTDLNGLKWRIQVKGVSRNYLSDFLEIFLNVELY